MANQRFRCLKLWRKLAKRELVIAGAGGIALLLLALPFVISDSRRSQHSSSIPVQPSVSDSVPLTTLLNARGKGAFCLDGSLPGYHFRKGFGSGSDNWLIHIEGGGWCDSIESCSSRKNTELGSSKYMDIPVLFNGIMSSHPSQNPDFFNWNRVKVRYCDGASFSGHPESELKSGSKLFFRGQLIWEAVMDELLSIGLANARQALLAGCSAGGLARIRSGSLYGIVKSKLYRFVGVEGRLLAPPQDGKGLATEEHMTAAVETRPISTVLIIVAMQAEALPIVNKFQLSEDINSVFPKGVPWVRYHGTYNDLQINIVLPGKDKVLGVDSVGTVSASLVTYASIQALRPDLIINAGTAGGFKAKGACIGDVFLASEVAFHDRRIPIPVFDLYGVGSRCACSTANILKELNLKVGKLSTGDSLDMTPHDESAITANDATIKDMEGAAVAYVAELLNVPAIFVKAVTDIIDGEKPTSEEFLQNLAAVTVALDQSVTRIVDFINGKCISDL